MNELTSVLIVDDEPAVRDLMSRWVTLLGLRPKAVGSAEEALDTLRTQHYDLAVIDVMMPGRDGLWLAGELRRDHPHTAVVIATAYTELLGKESEAAPVADLLVKPFQRERFELALDRGRVWRRQALDELQWHAQLSAEVRERTAQLRAEIVLRREAGAAEADILTALMVKGVPDVAAHGERVVRFVQSVARELRLKAELDDILVPAARFHDVGKLAIPDALLTKPSPLTAGEQAVMRKHVDAGAQILVSTKTLHAAAPIILASHEWFGGGGYPRKLAGDAIPVASRIIAVVDAYDTMTQGGPPALRFDSGDAVSELLRCRDAQFDPDVLGAFLAVLSRH